jgi:histidinol-phosphate aminotransferase
MRLNRNPEDIILGAGSEGVLSDILTAFMVPGDEALTTDAAFIGFTTMVRARGLVCRTAPYRDWHYDLDALASLVTDRTKLLYLANPNNPTGTAFTQPEFDLFMQGVPERVLVVLDEAYFEYARNDSTYPDSITPRYPNLIRLRTFSKAYGLAGLRIGYGVGPTDLIRSILKVKLPFEPCGPAMAAGLAALSDEPFLNRVVELNRSGLLRLQRGLSTLGFQVVPSQANFVMLVAASAGDAQRVFERVLSQGVIIRPLTAFGLPSCLRVTTALEEENQFCIEAFARI